MRRGWWIGAAVFGASLMTLLAARDTRRRSDVGDRLGSWVKMFGRERDRVSRPLRPLTRPGMGPDEVTPQPAPSPADIRLIECIRSRLGHVLSDARAIEVRAENGRVALEGPIPSAEVERLLHAIRTVPGVRGIANGLVVHVTQEGCAARTPLGDRVRATLNARGARAAMGIIGAAATFYGVARITRDAVRATSGSASGPPAVRPRGGYMTPRALALAGNPPRRTPA